MTNIVDIDVYDFKVGDVDDPEIYAASPLWEWEKSEQGQWVMEHSVEEPIYYRVPDNFDYCHKFVIRAKLRESDAVFFKLKWGKFK